MSSNSRNSGVDSNAIGTLAGVAASGGVAGAGSVRFGPRHRSSQ